MKIPSLLALSILSLVLAPPTAKAAVLVTGFGSGEYTSTFTDFPLENQTAGSYQLTGTDGGSSAYGALPLPVNISGSTVYLTLDATFTGTASSAFGIELFDADGDSRRYSANFSSFTQNVPTSVNFSFVQEFGSFNNVVVSIGFLTSGAPASTATVNMTMDTLTATPEPTSAALMMVGLVSLAARRRRQAA